MSETLPAAGLAPRGETGWSLGGRHTGLTDLPLAEQGERKARLRAIRRGRKAKGAQALRL